MRFAHGRFTEKLKEVNTRAPSSPTILFPLVILMVSELTFVLEEDAGCGAQRLLWLPRI